MSEMEDSIIENQGDVAAALIAGAGLGKRRDLPPGHSYALIPPGYSVHEFESTAHIEPPRKKIRLALHDAASFIGYVKLYDDGDGRIFADVLRTQFVGVLDYHEPGDGAARHCEHVAVYACRITPEWQTWTAHSGKQVSQSAFYEFLENNLPDVADPSNLLDIIRTLEATKDVKFASSMRASDGQVNFTYEEEIRGTAQKGTLQIPDKLILGIAPFQGSDRYRLEAKLRYRINNGALSLWFDLMRPQKVLEDAFAQTVKLVESETGITVLQGALP